MIRQTKIATDSRFENERAEAQYGSMARPCNAARLVSMHRFVAVCIVSVFFATTLSYFLTREIVQRDAELDGQLISNIVTGHGQQATLVKVLDERTDLINLGISTAAAEAVKRQFADHLNFLPDMQHATVYTADGKLIWTSNSGLTSKDGSADNELQAAIDLRTVTSKDYLSQSNHSVFQYKFETMFGANPAKFFVENYIPLQDANGNVIAVVNVYKEPGSLLDTIWHGYLLVWASTALAVVFLYLGMPRRTDKTVADKPPESVSQNIAQKVSVAAKHRINKRLKLIRGNAQINRVRRIG